MEELIDNRNNNNYMKSFPNIDWIVIFQRNRVERECGAKPHFWNYFFRNIAFCFVDNVDLRLLKRGDNSRILFYQSFIERESSRKQFYNVQQLVNSDLISYGPEKKNKIHILLGLYLLFFNLPFWFFQLIRVGAPFSERPRYIHSLIKFFFISRKINNLTSINNYNLLVTFCDAYPEESFISQLFKAKGKTTVTLQHGAFSAWRENELINSGVELRAFSSDYMLCWNKLTIDEAVKCGISSERLKVVGILGYVKDQPDDWICPNNNTFGVVIGHESFEEENLKLIECANRIAELKGMGYYLKLHPNYYEHYFDDKVSKEFYKGNIKKGIPISDYANMVDFSLVGSSSVYLELVYIRHDVIRYSTGGVTDKFKDVKIGKVLHSPQEVESLFGKDHEPSENGLDDLFDYLCGYKDVAREYKRFFSKYVS